MGSANGVHPLAVCTGDIKAQIAFFSDVLLSLRDRIRSRGVNVFGPLDHGMCHSIYFAGPEDLTLEIATSERAIDARAWIDPEVVELAGISAQELERYRRPASFEGRGGAVPQPPIDPTKPHQRSFPQAFYEKLLSLPDAEVTARLSESMPPVRVDAGEEPA